MSINRLSPLLVLVSLFLLLLGGTFPLIAAPLSLGNDEEGAGTGPIDSSQAAVITPTRTPTLAPASFLPSVRLDPTPTPTPTPTVTGGIPADNLAWEQAVITRVNEERVTHGLSPLNLSDQLTQAARRHGRDMADNNQLSHTGSDGSTAGERIAEAGYAYSWHGENIGWGFGSPDSVVAWWLGSAPHRANILHVEYTDIGVAYAWNGGSAFKHHWVINFGRPAGGDMADRTGAVCIYPSVHPLRGGSSLLVLLDCSLLTAP